MIRYLVEHKHCGTQTVIIGRDYYDACRRCGRDPKIWKLVRAIDQRNCGRPQFFYKSSALDVVRLKIGIDFFHKILYNITILNKERLLKMYKFTIKSYSGNETIKISNRNFGEKLAKQYLDCADVYAVEITNFDTGELVYYNAKG